MNRRMLSTLAASLFLAVPSLAADTEYTGTFEPRLVADRDGRPEDAVFRPAGDRSKIKLSEPVEAGAHVTSGMLYDPRTEKAGLLAFLAEAEDELPVLLVDVNGDGSIGDAERFELERTPEGYPNVFEGTVELSLSGGPFATFPLHVRAWRDIRHAELGPNDRLVLVSKAAFDAP